MTALAASPDGKTLVTASRNLLLRRWDTDTGEMLKAWKAGDGIVLSMTYLCVLEDDDDYHDD